MPGVRRQHIGHRRLQGADITHLEEIPLFGHVRRPAFTGENTGEHVLGGKLDSEPSSIIWISSARPGPSSLASRASIPALRNQPTTSPGDPVRGGPRRGPGEHGIVIKPAQAGVEGGEDAGGVHARPCAAYRARRLAGISGSRSSMPATHSGDITIGTRSGSGK